MRDKSKIAGILVIISSAFGFFYLALMLFQVFMFQTMFNQPFNRAFPQEFFQMALFFNLIFGIGFALLGTLAIIAGILTIKKKSWPLALAGAIIACITFYPCGLPAILLVSFAEDEFNKPSAPPATG
jgi:hypothetical protein